MTGDCCCGGNSHDHGPRKVLTKEEKIAKLTQYKEDLKKEIAAVDEALTELSK
ncbi:MAG: hypothetical protein QCH99_00510 [Candidatus Bathyarchaeota archaeon]|nr:hypothetical protein [Candidatus Bathyarchaeum tardum]